MTEELRVVGRADEGRSLASPRQGVQHQVDEVGSLEADLLGRSVRVVDRLGAEVTLVVGDSPEPQSTRKVLLVELQIGVVARVAVLAAPYLERGPGVPEEGDGLAMATPRGDLIRKVGRPRLACRHRRGRLALDLPFEGKKLAVEEERLAGRDQMGIGDEVLERVRRQHFLDSRPDAALAPSVGSGRGRPFVPRAVRALRQPDTPGWAAEMPAVGLDGGPELEVDRFVPRQQGQIPVGRRAGDDLHVARPLEVGEGAGNIPPDPPVHLPHPLEELLPEVGEADDLLLAGAREVLPRLGAGAPDVIVVKR
ncbi:MAG: hypothetical protein DME01_19215 [Candidatus Rokuibacteriota bacterium]|nr:MAG: hypothetical protein DME01_19215 [Candidatus Rokubacteria bacterium]